MLFENIIWPDEVKKASKCGNGSGKIKKGICFAVKCKIEDVRTNLEL